ncbi:hypothetical protein CASFOL_004918 [Castilleja foliolosa]|uniref:Ribonuclease H n=1 Tax=Castilleja foliolosa TaxID=1961234 RepID=A0ABD3ECM4_9LAMI
MASFYVVWKGKVPGIYLTWGECEKQIKGVRNVKYKKYKTRMEAVEAYVKSPPFSSSTTPPSNQETWSSSSNQETSDLVKVTVEGSVEAVCKLMKDFKL